MSENDFISDEELEALAGGSSMNFSRTTGSHTFRNGSVSWSQINNGATQFTINLNGKIIKDTLPAGGNRLEFLKKYLPTRS